MNTKIEILKECCEELQNNEIHKDNQGNDFLIIENCNLMRKLETLLRQKLPKKDILKINPSKNEYSSECIDYCTDDNWGYSDEYTCCYECMTIIRISPDSYYWTADYWSNEHGIYCKNCTNINEYLESLHNNPRKANTIFNYEEILKAGYSIVESGFENGWYGSNDNPVSILNKLLQNNHDREYIFSISEQGQFHTKFDIYVKDIEE